METKNNVGFKLSIADILKNDDEKKTVCVWQITKERGEFQGS